MIDVDLIEGCLLQCVAHVCVAVCNIAVVLI